FFSDLKNTAVAALGRPFTLGMLYDSRQDKLIPGFTLWDSTTLKENTVVSPQHSSAFEVTASDSIEDKAELLNVETSLKASFLGGLVEVGGSAKYLTDTKKSQNQGRVTLQYKATTKSKQLSMVQLGKKNMQYTEVFEQQLATHVVTGILYGANAFFVFNSEKTQSSSVQDLQGNMEAVIKEIPTIVIEGQGDLQLTDEEKALTKNLSCNFHGDFNLESNPTTFEDAVKTYQQLPKLLAEQEEEAVPLKVWLMPLKNLDAKAAQLTNEISSGLVRKAQSALEELNETVMRCNDALEDKVVKQFPKIQNKVISFKKLCNDYALTLRQTMGKKLPSIRAGEEDESVLEKLFQDRHKSPFSNINLNKWMDSEEREISVMKACLAMMEGTKTTIVQSRKELEELIWAPQVKQALCLVFTSLDGSDPYLTTLDDYLKSPTNLDFKPPAGDQWYLSSEVTTQMREKAKEFFDFAKAMKKNDSMVFLAAAIAIEKFKGATIFHYKQGSRVTDDFSRPELPAVEMIMDKSDLILYACDLNFDPNTAHKYLKLSDGDKKATFRGSHSYPPHPEKFDYHTQVMCKEGLAGRHYWEVVWNGYVGVAVAYKSIGRKGESHSCMFGMAENSWSMLHSGSDMGDVFSAYHKALEASVTPDTYGNRRLGLFLDWQAGTLSYYSVSSDTLSHIYTFRTKFTEPLYPGFWIQAPSFSVSLCQV
uniref:Neoverrucotoxin subunit alpha-like n=1 Tax=Myripristis murdjan TaxID=586833 RepID=A0A667XUY1_9TELE